MIYTAMAKDTKVLAANSLVDIKSIVELVKKRRSSKDVDFKIRPPKDSYELLSHYTDLFYAQKFCKNIDKMILLNFEDQTITKEDHLKYLDSSYFSNLCNSEKNIITNMKIFNSDELGIIKSGKDDDNVIDGFSIKAMNLSLLKNHINKEPVFTYFFPHVSMLFLKILSELDDVTIYRNSYRGAKSKKWGLKPERDVRRYYQFCKSLDKGFSAHYDFRFPSNFLDHFRGT